MSGVQMLHGSNTIVISGYAPHIATLKDGTTVTISGQYPFADSVNITLSRKSASAVAEAQQPWSVLLRIPCWVDSAHVVVDSAAPAAAAPCGHHKVQGLDSSKTSVSVTLFFGHSIKVVTGKWKGGGIEVHRGPLLFTLPVPATINRTLLNATGNASVWYSRFDLDNSVGARPWKVALQDPNTSLKFAGFTPLADVPFNYSFPAATINGRARPVMGYTNRRGHPSAMPPTSPVGPQDYNGSLIDVVLIPIAQSNLRVTVLPTLG